METDPQDKKKIVKQEISNSVTQAITDEAEILLYPEVFFSDTDLAFLITTLNTLNSRKLKLVLAGSVHRSKGTFWVNRMPILYRNQHGLWEKLVDYDKKIPLSYNDKVQYLRENMEYGPNITLLKAAGGMIGVAICRVVLDMLNPANPMHRYCDFVDLLLVISYSMGPTNLFVAVGESMVHWHHCAVGYVNTYCAPGSGAKANYAEIAYIVYPQAKTNRGANLLGAVSSSILIQGNARLPSCNPKHQFYRRVSSRHSL